MANRSQVINIDCDMSIQQAMEPGKVLVLVLDGQQGKAKKFEAVHHGKTIIETTKGTAFRISFEENELF